MAETIRGINVVIGAETTGLSKALADVNGKVRDTQNELKQVERLLKLDPSNTELLAQKQKLLTNAVADTREKLDKLRAVQEQVNEQFRKGEISEGQYRAFQREIAKTQADLDNFEKQLKKTNPALEAFGAKAKDIGGKLSDVGGKLTKYLTVPLAAAGAGLVAVGNQFDEAFDKIRVGTGATGKALEGLQDDFRAVAKTVPASFGNISTAIADYNTRLGLAGKPLQDLARQTLELARITGTDLATVIEQTSQSFQAFKLPAGQYGAALDYVFKVSQSTGIQMRQLQQDLIKFAPALKQLGLNFQESATLIGQLDKAGVDVEQTMAGLTKAVATLAKQGVKDASQAIQILFDRIKNAPTDIQGTQAALEVFGARAGPALASAIREGKLSYDELLKTLQGSKETILGVAGETSDWAEKWAILKNNLLLALEPLAGKLFDAIGQLTPLLQAAVDLIARLVEGFSNLSPGVQTAILVVAGLLAALGPVLSTIGALATAAGALGVSIGALAAPIGIAIAAIAALIAIGVTLYKNWDEIKAYLTKTWETIRDTAANVWNTIVTTIQDLWNGLINTIKELTTGWVNAIADAWKWLYDHNYYFQNLVDLVINLWTRLKETTTAIWTAIKDGLSAAWQTIKDTVTNAATALRDRVVEAWNNLLARLRDIAFRVREAIVSPFERAKEMILDIVSDAWNWGKNLIQNIIDGIKSKISALTSAVSGVASKISGYLGFHSPAKEGPGRDADKWMPNLMAMLVQGIERGIPDVQKALNSVLSVSLPNIPSLGFSQPALASPGSPQGSAPEIHLHIGTLIGDDLGLKKLEQTLYKFRIAEQQRIGG